MRSKHPDKEVEKAIQHAESKGWRVETNRAHWGVMFCPKNNKDCGGGAHCMTSINGSPKNPSNHAKQIKRIVDKCIFLVGENHENE